MVLPDQVACFRVERLYGVHRVGQVHDAVMNDGRRLVRLPLVHRPDPRELQLFHVVVRHLRQRAVAPAHVIPPDHQPVAWIGIAEHLVGDGHEVLHFTCDGEAFELAAVAPTPLLVEEAQHLDADHAVLEDAAPRQQHRILEHKTNVTPRLADR